MKNLLTSLKKLGKKMTGEDVTGADLVTIVDDIANKYTGGGGSGGGDIMVIHADAIDEEAVDFTVNDATAGQIYEAMAQGSVIILALALPEFNAFFYLSLGRRENDGHHEFTFGPGNALGLYLTAQNANAYPSTVS